ncbi:MAG: hypothetical protein WDZ63_11120 [Burkholderiales bacterium]
MEKMTSTRYAPEVMAICDFLAISLPVAAQQRHIIESAVRGYTRAYRGLTRDVIRFDTDPQRGFSQGQTQGEYWFED